MDITTFIILAAFLIVAVFGLVREIITTPKELRLRGCISSGVAVIAFYLVVNYIASR